MIQRWKFYLHLGWLDLVRLWPTTRHHVIIVAGICLPILLLLGIKRGHVAELRRDLVTSPIGRQVIFWSARKGALMDRDAIVMLANELPTVEIIIPETQRVIRLSRKSNSESKEATENAVSATIYATRPGDPQLAQLGVESPKPGDRSIILSEGLANRLGSIVGDFVTLQLTRGRDDQAEEVSLICAVQFVIPTDQKDSMIGYMDLDLLDSFEQFVRGNSVAAFDWPSARISARDGYSSYLIFCENSNDLTDDDRRFFEERGFILNDRTESPPYPLENLLNPNAKASLRIYEASTSQLSQKPEPRLFISPSEISEQTQADDVILPWNPPATALINGTEWILAGVSLSRRSWMREYFAKPNLAFDYDAAPFQFVTIQSGNNSEIDWVLSGDQILSLLSGLPIIDKERFEQNVAVVDKANSHLATVYDERQDDFEPHDLPSIAVVPATLTSWLAAHRAGLVRYDPLVGLFVPIAEAPIYDRARLYAKTIDDVPHVVAALSQRHFAVMSETGRIAEIHRQDRSLQLLVLVVGMGVFLFGVVTVVSVLMDSTDRKRGTIGILRVMGMSSRGIFVSILLRSTMIGLFAAVLSLICGTGLAVLLEWKPVAYPGWFDWKPIVQIELDPRDLAFVAAGALICCGLGSLPPAWKASRLDPFDAIVDGRFR